MSNWPFGRIQTLNPGQPITAALINRMQDGINQVATSLHGYGLVTILPSRVNVSGTWSSNTVGSITESTNAVTTRVFFGVPIGVRLQKVVVVGRQESGATAQFTARLIETASTATVTGISTIATSDGVTVGADQTIESLVPNGGYVTVLGRRYAVELGTTGGGGTQRTLISATPVFDFI
jgi:hypothetical protein